MHRDASQSRANYFSDALPPLLSSCPDCLPLVQAVAVDQARIQLRSELAWAKARLAVVCHMCSGLRAKLQQAQADREQAGKQASKCRPEPVMHVAATCHDTTKLSSHAHD